ncbi:TRAP transporter large permease [Paramaledivibacter caminithermalis]|jgi:C4-dicarboxylate transporter DctM subunit|uniref:C4-dicarboxylate transporter, DctM subunit n=1 Tax=Paramaledivibacter caminithermalis (strain DSM 15212 / CIP 107654 / DViRD3) TaxID=1121301 RepID=A0A1M6QE70_PARC5|nr:TRAP transporter large permease [Paramaledivibacter caminithermalis]SHK18501.1 C4-dicarboxylate transporter, DctM subunit [Paramaledivibacter caminithermalis DSM 15212]
MQILLLFILLIGFITLSVPIGIALGLSTAITLILTSNIPLMMLAQNAFAGLDSFPLMAIPFFILAGNLMRYGGVSKRLLNFTDSIVGFLTGGLGMVTTMACMFFAAISGSGPATVSAIGSFMMPAMKEKNYDEGYSAAITAVAGSMGVIIPPSIPFVIYGVATGASIGDLFIAGIIPGALIGIGLMIANFFISKKCGYVGNIERPPLLKSFKEAIPSLLVPIIILGGIYGGIFTPTEAAVVGVVYALVVGIFINKELGWKEIRESLRDTVLINGATTFMIGLSMSFASFLTMEQVPAHFASLLLGISDSKIIILILINIFLLIVGCFVDNISACVILAPIFLPIVTKLGMSPVQFGVVMTINLAIGFVTPPYGANLFVASAVGNVTMEKLTKHVLPLIAVMLVVLILTTYFPFVSMGLTHILGR